MKNTFYLSLIILATLFASCGGGEQSTANKNIENTKENIVFAVPFAPVSYPILKMIEDGTFAKGQCKLELLIWNTPDQLKAMVAGNQVDIFATPSNVAAMFYNKGLDVSLLNISIWRAMWLVSRSNDKKNCPTLKAKQLQCPLRAICRI